MPLGVGGCTVDEDAMDSSVSGVGERDRGVGSGSSVWISISPVERGAGASVWVEEVDVVGGGVVWMLRETVGVGIVCVELSETKDLESYWVHALAYSFEVSMVVDFALFALLFPP